MNNGFPCPRLQDALGTVGPPASNGKVNTAPKARLNIRRSGRARRALIQDRVAPLPNLITLI